jgi:hypothetical protein
MPLYTFLLSLLNVLVQIANKTGLQKEKLIYGQLSLRQERDLHIARVDPLIGKKLGRYVFLFPPNVSVGAVTRLRTECPKNRH